MGDVHVRVADHHLRRGEIEEAECATFFMLFTETK
jgi:hypothetical protein